MKSLLSLLLLGLSALPAFAQEPAGKKLLLITESRGFRHGVVTRRTTLAKEIDAKTLKVPGLDVNVAKDGKANANFVGRISGTKTFAVEDDGKTVAKVEPSLVEITFQELAKKAGFEVTCSQDSRTELTGDNLKKYDAVWFYTTGELPLSDAQKSDLLAFIRAGKGFGGCHSAADTFYKWKEYGELLGAYFAGHPAGLQDITIKVEDGTHPATRELPKSFKYKDEIYKYRDPAGTDKLPPSHVLMRIDMDVTKNQWRSDNNNPLAWTRDYGKGRVFYTALGHDDHVWRDPMYQQHLLGGLHYLFNQEAASPGAKE